MSQEVGAHLSERQTPLRQSTKDRLWDREGKTAGLKEGKIRPTVSIANSFRRVSRGSQINYNGPIDAMDSIKFLETFSCGRWKRTEERQSHLIRIRQLKAFDCKKNKRIKAA